MDGDMACQCRRLFAREIHFTHTIYTTGWKHGMPVYRRLFTREISFYPQQGRNMACQCIPRKFHFTNTVYNRMGIWHASVDVCLPREHGMPV